MPRNYFTNYHNPETETSSRLRNLNQTRAKHESDFTLLYLSDIYSKNSNQSVSRVTLSDDKYTISYIVRDGINTTQCHYKKKNIFTPGSPQNSRFPRKTDTM